MPAYGQTTPMEKRFVIDLNPSIPPGELSAAGRIRRAFLREHESLTVFDTAARFGVGQSSVHQVHADLRKLGFRLIKTASPDGFRYKVANPEHRPSMADFANARQAKAARGTRGKKKSLVASAVMPAARRRQKAIPMPALPTIGAQLMVTGIAWDPDQGIAHLALRNGTVSYTVRIDGQTVVETAEHD